MPSDKPFKAYQVQEDHEGTAIVIYAQHRATAQNWGSCSLNCDFQDVRCFRVPGWDHLYPEGPTDEDKWEDGWWFSCNMCMYGRTDQDSGHHETGGGFYCSSCADNFTTMREVKTPRFIAKFLGDNPYASWRGGDGKLPLKPLGNDSPYYWYDPHERVY